MLQFLKRRKRDPKEVIQELFGDTELPSFPTAVMEVLGLLRSPDSIVRDIEVQIEHDPGLSVRVLRTVNSASFGLTKRVTQVGHAVNLLGRSRLEAIVLSVAVNAALPMQSEHGFDYASFWLTASRRACLARLIAQQLHPATEVEAFTAGLLQDMGIPLLVMRKEAEYVKVYQAWQQKPTNSLEEIERDAFGYDHTDVGAVIAASWDLPTYLIEAISGHHTWGGTHHVEEAVQLVSLLQDSEMDEGFQQLLDIGTSEFGVASELLQSLVAEAIENANDYYRVLIK